MTIRTPNPSANRQSLLDLNRVKARLAVNQQKIASGEAISRLGDDPTGAALIVDFRNSVNRNKAYMDQADTSLNFLSTAESTVSTMENSVVRLMELATNGLDTTLTASSRSASAPEVSGIRDSLLDLANTQLQGKYLFAGTDTTTKPFAYNTAVPATPPVLYSGNSGNISLDVSVSSSVVTNVSGTEVCFGGGTAGSSTDLFQATTDLMNGLNTNNTALIQTAYNNLQTIRGNLDSVVTELGGRQAGVTSLKSDLGSYNLSLQSIQGTYEDVDYPATITEWTSDQTVQQAALATMAKVNKQNLFDFLT